MSLNLHSDGQISDIAPDIMTRGSDSHVQFEFVKGTWFEVAGYTVVWRVEGIDPTTCGFVAIYEVCFIIFPYWISGWLNR